MRKDMFARQCEQINKVLVSACVTEVQKEKAQICVCWRKLGDAYFPQER